MSSKFLLGKDFLTFLKYSFYNPFNTSDADRKNNFSSSFGAAMMNYGVLFGYTGLLSIATIYSLIRDYAYGYSVSFKNFLSILFKIFVNTFIIISFVLLFTYTAEVFIDKNDALIKEEEQKAAEEKQAEEVKDEKTETVVETN